MLKTNTGISSIKPSGIGKSINNPTFIVGRVNYVILDDKTDPKLFNEYGNWGSIGTILFENVKGNGKRTKITSQPATPLFPNTKIYPLINEIVYIIALPDSTLGPLSTISTKYYYFQPINIFNNNHHNALPNFLDINNIIPPSIVTGKQFH